MQVPRAFGDDDDSRATVLDHRPAAAKTFAEHAEVPPTWKSRAVTETMDDVLQWPYRWWCACESQQEPVDGGPEFIVDGTGPRYAPPNGQLSHPLGPRDRNVPRFSASREERPRGELLRKGPLLYLTGEGKMQMVNLALYVGGFTITRCADVQAAVREAARIHEGGGPDDQNGDNGGTSTMAQEVPEEEHEPMVERAFSPFSIVDRTTLSVKQGPAALWAPFKLTVVRPEGDCQYHFVSTGKEAASCRDAWVQHVSAALRQVTCSLFPRHSLDVRPLRGVPSTATRIMAGYLLRCDAKDNVSLLYAELHAYSKGEARVAFYKDSWCEQKVDTMRLTAKMGVYSCKGVDCSIFVVDGHCFSARSEDERVLWLRAIGNIKVKLMFDAPDPTMQELSFFRGAVLERILELDSSKSPQADTKADPLLPRTPRTVPETPLGDKLQPEPTDDASDCGGHPTSQSRDASRFSAKQQVLNGTQDEAQDRVKEVLEQMEAGECRTLLAPFVGGSPPTSPGLTARREPLSTISSDGHGGQGPGAVFSTVAGVPYGAAQGGSSASSTRDTHSRSSDQVDHALALPVLTTEHAFSDEEFPDEEHFAEGATARRSHNHGDAVVLVSAHHSFSSSPGPMENLHGHINHNNNHDRRA